MCPSSIFVTQKQRFNKTCSWLTYVAKGLKVPGMGEHTVFRVSKFMVFTEDLECELSTQFQLKLSLGDSP